MHLDARPATSDDEAELRRLMVEAVAAVRDARGGALMLRERFGDGGPAELANVALGAADRVLVGLIDGVPVGFALWRIDDSARPRIAVLDAVYVTPGARGVSVGECLLDRVLVDVADAGCRGLDGVALPGDRATKNFFERFGMVARAIVVHRRIDDGGATDG